MALSMFSKVKEFPNFCRKFRLCYIENQRFIHISPVLQSKKKKYPESSQVEGDKMEKAVKDVASNFGKHRKNVEADLTEQEGKLRKTKYKKDKAGNKFTPLNDKGSHTILNPNEVEVPDNELIQKMEEEPSGKDFILESLNAMKVETKEKIIIPSDIRKRRMDLFGERPLGIFSTDNLKLSKVEDNTFHEKLESESAVKFQANLFPLNGFQEMIQQTLEGKLWRFPIDNEQGWESEENVPFHEHIFLDDAIEDFPKQGPIRNFMELVITGLSKNPYLTVEEKHEHIDWYRKYFKEPEKQAVLKESLGERAKFTELK